MDLPWRVNDQDVVLGLTFLNKHLEIKRKQITVDPLCTWSLLQHLYPLILALLKLLRNEVLPACLDV